MKSIFEGQRSEKFKDVNDTVVDLRYPHAEEISWWDKGLEIKMMGKEEVYL